MVDLTFASRAKNFVPLSLLRTIAGAQLSAIPEDIVYLGEDGVKAIKGMVLVTRGRLSVQRVQEDAWRAIEQLSEKGGWKEPATKPKKTAKQPSAIGVDTNKAIPKASAKKQAATSSKTEKDEEHVDTLEVKEQGIDGEIGSKQLKGPVKASKRKREPESPEKTDGLRRSTRTRK